MLHSTSFPSVGVSVCPSVSQWVSLLVFVCPLLLSLSHIFSLTLTCTYLSSWHRLSTFACYLSKSALGEVTLQECRVYIQHSLQLFYASCDIVSQHWDYTVTAKCIVEVPQVWTKCLPNHIQEVCLSMSQQNLGFLGGQNDLGKTERTDIPLTLLPSLLNKSTIMYRYRKSSGMTEYLYGPSGVITQAMTVVRRQKWALVSVGLDQHFGSMWSQKCFPIRQGGPVGVTLTPTQTLTLSGGLQRPLASVTMYHMICSTKPPEFNVHHILSAMYISQSKFIKLSVFAKSHTSL